MANDPLDRHGVPRVCLVCNEPVNPFEHVDTGTVTYRHVSPFRVYNHAVLAVPREEMDNPKTLCDFCGSPGVIWRYEGPRILVDTEPEVQDYGIFWVGCDTCHKFIAVKDTTRLINRLLNRPEVRKLWAGNRAKRASMAQMIDQMQGAYVRGIYSIERIHPIEG